MWRRAANDERGLSTLEWILLVAAVGGLATAGVIIVRNAVGGAGDQVNDEARNERLAQRDVNEFVGFYDDRNEPEVDNSLTKTTSSDVRKRCSFSHEKTAAAVQLKSLRKWRGAFSLVVVKPKSNGAKVGTATNADDLWCDAVPTNNLENHCVDAFGSNPRDNLQNVVWTNAAADPGQDCVQ